MSAREIETRRRRRLRREALAEAEREHVLGHAVWEAPSGGMSFYEAVIRAQDQIVRDTLVIGRWFASRCWVRLRVERQMVRDLEWVLALNPEWSYAVERGVPPATTGRELIPS